MDVQRQAKDPGSILGAAMLDGSFILATSAIHLITVVPACLLGLTQAKVALNSLIHPSPGDPKHPRGPKAPQGVPSTPGGRHGMEPWAKFPKPLPMGTARRLPRAVFSERLITSFICRSLTRDYKVYILLQLLLLGEVLVSQCNKCNPHNFICKLSWDWEGPHSWCLFQNSSCPPSPDI